MLKDVPSFEGLYAVTEDGRVWGYAKHRSPAGWRKTITNWSGYERIQLRKDGKYHYMAIHRLVAMTYIENPNGYSEVNHIDGDKQNNRVDNLEWCTHSENIRHADRTGLRKNASGKDHYQSKRKLILGGI